MNNQLQIHKSTTSGLLKHLDTSIRRLMTFPLARGFVQRRDVVPGNNIMERRVVPGNNIPYESSLCRNPKSLYVLWQEWEFGVGGRKAAKLFSSRERGRVKYQYSLRKHFWDLCLDMIRRGYTSDTAIDKIYEVYSRSNSCTKILRQIREDKKNRGNARC